MTYSYRAAFADWLACAVAGLSEPVVDIARAAGYNRHADVLLAGAAGHVLDFDDTYPPGLAHLSAPTAPAALLVGADRGATLGEVLRAYRCGFETMAATARASHPRLYERGWHPTAVCGGIGAATAVAQLLELPERRRATARRLAMVSAGGLRASFGSQGKALQVGAAAVGGVCAALLAAEGATVSPGVVNGFERAYGATVAIPDEPAISHNWLKAYPCCLQTHAAIEATTELRRNGAHGRGRLRVLVHPRSRQAAPYDDVTDGLQAKFSIPYTVAWTLLHGPPGTDTFMTVDPATRTLAGRVAVHVDEGLQESEAVVTWHDDGDEQSSRVKSARGSPQRPLTARERTEKARRLAGNRLVGILEDPTTPAREVARAAGLSA